jgi:hypothetical protein
MDRHAGLLIIPLLQSIWPKSHFFDGLAQANRYYFAVQQPYVVGAVV